MRERPPSRWRPCAAVDSPWLRFPVVVSRSGGHLLERRFVVAFISDPLEALAVELAEPDAVGLVGDVEVEDGPDEREAAGLAGEPADHLRASFDLAERSLKQVCAAPAAAVPSRVAQ